MSQPSDIFSDASSNMVPVEIPTFVQPPDQAPEQRGTASVPERSVVWSATRSEFQDLMGYPHPKLQRIDRRVLAWQEQANARVPTRVLQSQTPTVPALNHTLGPPRKLERSTTALELVPAPPPPPVPTHPRHPCALPQRTESALTGDIASYPDVDYHEMLRLLALEYRAVHEDFDTHVSCSQRTYVESDSSQSQSLTGTGLGEVEEDSVEVHEGGSVTVVQDTGGF